MRIQNILVSALLITLTAAFSETQAQTVITEWNFDGADNTSIPGGTNSPQPSTGTGTAHLVGSAISPGFNAGYTGSCNTSSGSCGWQTTAYPDQSTASGTAGVEFRVSTVGFRDIVFDYAHRASGTSSRWARIEYMTDGCTWNVLANNGGGLSPHDTYYDFSFDLSACEECNNNPDFRMRIVSIFSPVGFSDFGNTYGANQAYQQARATPTNAGHNYTGATGTWRFDNVSVLGSPAPHTISTGVSTGVPVCVGESITIPYTASGTFTGGNVFTAQLSDEFGCFSNPVDIGSVTSTTSGSIAADVPLSTIAGTGYRVRVIAANPLIYGVPSSSSVTVNALPTATASAMESVLCAGQPTVLTGGGASSYVWDNSAINGQSISPSATTTYTVIGTDVNGCENSASVQVTVNPLPTVTAQATETVLCAGESTVLSGNGALTYAWDNSAVDGQAFVPTQSTTYTVVGTDGNSCENTATVNITVNALPTVTANASETELCGGGSTVLTGNGAVSYAWDNGVTDGETITPTQNTTFTVTGTDGNGCENTATVTVTVNTLPTVTASATETQLCDGTSTVPSGSGALTYAWDNGAVNGQAIVPSASTTYTVVGTDSNGCENSASVSVTVNPLPMVTGNASETEICLGESTVLSGNGALTYAWDNSAVDGQAIVPTQSTTYTVVGTDGNSCENTATVDITVNALPTVTANASETVLCEGESTILTGNGAVSYAWDNGVTDGETITPTQSTSYTVVGTDGNGCENSASVSVTVNTLPAVTASASETTLCEGASTVLSGSGALSYVWENGVVNGEAITPSESTTFTVTGTDGNGCENSASVSLTVNPLPMVTGNASETEICLGESTVLFGSGALSFAWDNGAENGQAIVPTVSTTYTVIGTDGNGCENSASIDITVNQLPSATITASGPTDLCEGSSVTLSANPIGSYVWNTGSTDAAITVDSEGDFSVTVTDGNGCSNTSEVVQVSVFETIVAEVTASGSLTFCEGQSVTLTAPDGIDHQWSNGATTQSITLDENSIVSVSLTDANGCASASDVLIVSVNPLPEITITANGATEFCDGENVELVATSGVSYTWSTTATTPSIVVSSSAEVSVTVTDVNGCQNTSDMVQVSVSVPQQAFITASASTVCPGESASLTASAGSQFLWDTGADDQSIEITQHGDYSVIVTDADGCQSSASITIDEGAAVVAELVVTGELELCAGETVTLSVSDAGSFDGFLWSNGSTSSSITVSLAADYSVTVNGSAACVPAVQVLGPVTVTVSSVVPQVSQDGNILSVTNGPFISYQWFRNGSPIPGADGPTHEATISGNYYVRVTGQGGCVTQSMNSEVTVNVSVTELDRPVLAVWPNPSASGIFQLSETTTGTVFNMVGLMVAEVERTSVIDLSSAGSGVYVLRTAQGTLHRLIR